MLPEYQLKVADLYYIPIGNVKSSCLTFLTLPIGIYVFHNENMQLYLRLGLKLKKIYSINHDNC